MSNPTDAAWFVLKEMAMSMPSDRCPNCQGTGYETYLNLSMPCRVCGGTGKRDMRSLTPQQIEAMQEAEAQTRQDDAAYET